MISSSGQYFISLDHVRALAVIVVFLWHFNHVENGHLAPPDYFLLSLFTEGHTGVAIFMTLSGYLFSKLLEGKSIRVKAFIWNRFLRLAPLLTFMIVVKGALTYSRNESLLAYIKGVVSGFYLPSLPNGGWSITVEFHFYLLLPLILLIAGSGKHRLFLILASALTLRALIYYSSGTIQALSYFTLLGRIDQFLLGFMAYKYRTYICGKHLRAIGILCLFYCYYWCFDRLGGFYGNIAYPSPSSVWLYHPTLEGLAYSTAIAWYDTSFQHSHNLLSKFIALIGQCSYSIYLLHMFIVFDLSKFIHAHIIALDNEITTMLAGAICIVVLTPIWYLFWRFVELPPMKYRTNYLKDP